MNDGGFVRRTLRSGVMLVLTLFAVPAQAQEVQVPLDEGGRLQVIDPALALRLELFPEHAEIHEVRLFQTGEDAYELVVQYREDGQLLRERRSLSGEEVMELRRAVSERLVTTVRGGREQHVDGRRTLLVTTTLSGGLHGLLLPVALGVDDPEILGALPLIGMAVGFGVPFMMTRGHFISDSYAGMAAYGAVQGLAHGFLLTRVMGDDLSLEATAGIASLMGMGQTVAGYSIARRYDFSAGQSEAISYGGLLGFGYGLGIAALVQGDDLDEDLGAFVAGTMIAGSLAGTAAGYTLATRTGMTAGDTRIMGMTALLGLQTAGAALILADVADDQVRMPAGVLMAGTTAGLVAGHLLVRDRDFSRADANVVGQGMSAGSFLGAGTTMLLGGGERTAAVLGLAGSVAGFWVTYATYASRAREASESGFRLSVHPEGLFMRSPGPAVDPSYAVPFASASWRW